MKKRYPDATQYSFDFDDYREVAEPGGLPAVPAPERIMFISFGSGSSGNACYLGNSDGTGLIIDAGIDESIIEKELAANGISMQSVRGLLLTHDHSDHIRYAYKLLRNHKHLRLFCTNRVLNGLLRRHSISRRIKEYHVAIFKEIPFTVAGFQITAFDVPHDGSDNMGFSLKYGDRHFVLATDMGEIQERARHYISRANYLVIESNYDSDMLRLGSYPEYLKARIRAEKGHMDNEATAAFLREIAGSRLEYVFLCHLSQDNNTPELALQASSRALLEAGLSVGDGSDSLDDRGKQIHLCVLPRHEASRKFIFRI